MLVDHAPLLVAQIGRWRYTKSCYYAQDLVDITMELETKEKGKEIEATLSENMAEVIVSRHRFVAEEEIAHLLDKLSHCRSSLSLRPPIPRSTSDICV